MCAPAALGSEGSDGLFNEAIIALAPRLGLGAERGTLRGRVVQVNAKHLSAARRGRQALKLNLFEDAVLEVRIERIRPTRTGYYLSGHVVGWTAAKYATLVGLLTRRVVRHPSQDDGAVGVR